MAREDKYAAGLAGGALLAAGGAGAVGAGRRMRREGRATVRANSGSRGDKVRGGRLVRAGADDVRSGQRGLGQFRQVAGKDGKTRYMKPGGGFAPTKGLNEQIQRGKDVAGKGRGMIAGAGLKRSRSAAGVKAMKRGRLVARAGGAAAVLGAAGAVGSVAAGERYRGKRVRQMDAALNPTSAQREQRRERPASEYRAMRPQGGLLVDAKGYPVKVSPRAASDWLRQAERGAQ
jgi:hypothetical protein